MGFSSQRGLRQSFPATLLPYFQALRPRQWTKNLVVFAAPLFAFSLNWQTLADIGLAFALFCCASSSFYLINDIADVEADRRHPVKCQRPIAAGRVSIPAALCMAIVLLGGALTLGWRHAPALGIVLLSYAVLQVAYNLKLKHTPLLDIVAIAMGFVLRACAGGAATGLTLSPWFLLCTAMLALFLGIEKRKAELRLAKGRGGKTRAVLRRYSLPLLTRMESTVTTGTIMSYALWSSGPVVNGASTSWMLLTLPFVLYGVFRYQLLSDPKPASRQLAGHESTERPEEVLLKDFPILATTIAWMATSFAILFLQHQGGLS
ncbi:MAG TPA: decaprenyl-phosphate phosphoribosyltransferase [Oscillatoriales cyanobacterium M59_W2019_021]|nr:MAG: decaprenyl-phosphate phosphoribosyltransferase [Cyanobacteria bacterium J055]HIK31304.1 decaprenyl-phosphate phosphoribosyltransferase [Oscillatoriales cyanobacterium M4454_W2019_049]HIK51838.1 decaprenyl-phosphate phosphoribosyltransferase [Oscillatoriales cyanobacterium M59_W2019_021]